MKILILGGTGAMGVDLVRILAQQGKNVTVTSRLERKTEYSNVRYAEGDAHDSIFLKSLLSEDYDAIVDFMVYKTEEFRKRRDMLLNATQQYVFLSSSRVYANCKEPITEDSPRLLDTTTDKEYLKTDEYALTKARQENMLLESGKTNWTIIRPYITYSSQRLQLGVYEKELWLYRALNDRTIVFPKTIADKYTTMTLGRDVADGLSKLIGNESAKGQIFHITTDQAIKWDNVLAVYKRVFKETIGREIKVLYVDDAKPVYETMGNKYQVVYDRLFDRRFDNNKFLQTVGKCEFTAPEVGLEMCLRDFFKKREFRKVSYSSLAQMDKISKDRARLSQVPEIGEKGKYILKRYLPNKVIHSIKAALKK